MLDTFKKATPEALEAVREEMAVRKTNEVFLLFSMGSQFDHLIVQRVSKLGVFCLVADPASVTAEDVRELGPKGIIISGGPASVHAEPPPFDNEIFDLGIPVFGICLGAQMIASASGITVREGTEREFSVETLKVLNSFGIVERAMHGSLVQQSHGDVIDPDVNDERIIVLASTTHSPVAAFKIADRELYGVQFHPEVTETEFGEGFFSIFCFGVCHAKDRYPAQDEAKRKIASLRKQIGDKNVLLLLSGGSDSATVALLLKEAMAGSKGKLTGLYIKGVDRPDDEAFVRKHFGNQDWITLKVVDETALFLEVLKGKTTMRDKRRAMRDGGYVPVANREVALADASFVAQGTLYTDLAEAGKGHATGARRAVIKEHHNVVDFVVPKLEPLSDCVKDGGRAIGRSLGAPEELMQRHPFPGPGRVVRIEGPITAEKLTMSDQLDALYIEELRKAGQYHKVWQAGIVITESMHTFTKGDDAGSGPVIAIWSVWSTNGFTAQAAELPWDLLKLLARRIGNEVKGVGAVVYRISDKPFSTIEWG